jgi:hypothetical protein
MRPATGEVPHFSQGPDDRAVRPVSPLGPAEPVGDPLALPEEAGVHLRVLPDLWPFWDAVVGSTLRSSGIRLRNALPGNGPRA